MSEWRNWPTLTSSGQVKLAWRGGHAQKTEAILFFPFSFSTFPPPIPQHRRNWPDPRNHNPGPLFLASARKCERPPFIGSSTLDSCVASSHSFKNFLWHCLLFPPRALLALHIFFCWMKRLGWNPSPNDSARINSFERLSPSYKGITPCGSLSRFRENKIKILFERISWTGENGGNFYATPS